MISDGIFEFTSKLYQVINDHTRPYVTYLIFAICSFISFGMVTFFVPEMKGKNYQEIRKRQNVSISIRNIKGRRRRKTGRN